MKETLLEKALKEPVSRRTIRHVVTDEHVDLVFAWLKGEVTPKQVCVAMGLDIEQGNYQRFFANYLREAYRMGRLILK